MAMDIEKKLKELIVDVATQDVNINSINQNTSLTNDLGYDSVQIIRLIIEVESEFNIAIEDEDLEVENLINYYNLRNMIERKIGDCK